MSIRFLTLLFFLVLAGISSATTDTLSPWLTVRAWNDALRDSNAETAERLTSKTVEGTKYWKNVNGIAGLVKIFEKGRDNFMPCTLLREAINSKQATVAYRCPRKDGSVRIWQDILLQENGVWKVAPQHVQAIRVK